MGRPATRLGDADITHCTTPFRAMGSSNVFINGRPASRQGDYNTVHLLPCSCPPCCCPHSAPIAVGSRSVFVNYRMAGRLGDPIAGCTFVGQGSPNVFIGG
ncbi:MAG: hypothetical protein CL489_17420 [Acidobacteria bacterium]|nr:hypothetical protein [Acidobacteriota bacterium]|tara:strand:+ start:178 stop:480 length:303 start_codon:yes stop_codon:yes gene_type:complete